ncbi:MAG TPA: hypothetical protein VK875_11165 [Euzebyales bacterium]|nr:hypothetical protein [Euzebyales bacterium]
MQQRTDHAVVIGGSMGGLLAARVLSERFDRVTVLDRDTMPPVGEQRRGVPQGRHAHALLGRGREVLEDLFPGLTDDLVARGAVTGDPQATTRWINERHRMRRAPSGLLGLAVSRPLLEGVVRQRLGDLHNVEIVARTDVTGLVTDEDATRVTGVRARHRDHREVRELSADLVVDAAGRGSPGATWLAALGYAEPSREEVRIDTAYASRLYRRTPGDLDDDRAVISAATPGIPRFGVIIALEGDRWIVTMGGMFGEAVPSDPDGHRAFAASLACDDIAEFLRDAEPLDDLVRARYPASVRRRYERVKRFPEGYLVFGDAICSFNPIYGQGMTVAACEALVLRRCLQAGTGRLARRFFRQAARVIDGPWDIAVGGDLRFPDVEGHRTVRVRVVNAYLSRLHLAASRDPAVGLAFLRVANLLDHPARLLSPAVALRVARAHLRRPEPSDQPAAVADRAVTLEVTP